MTRRQFLSLSIATSSLVLPGISRAGEATPHIEVLDRRIISREPQYYHGWPTLARRSNGQLVLVYSGGREQHVCPFGRVELMVSANEGQSWSWPQVLFDSPLDDRDAGVLATAKDSLLVTTFTSLAYEAVLKQALAKKADEPGAWPAERLSSWQAARDRLTPEQRQSGLGQWMLRSSDGGLSWSARYETPVNSPHGPIQLADGRLLYAGKELWTPAQRVGICGSPDDGQTWHWLAEIPARPHDDPRKYHELHAAEIDDRLLVHIRNENAKNQGETLQTESSDGGRTWSIPHSIGVWGLPSFLLRLRSGHLLMTYGYRRSPFGNQARLSQDHGNSWSNPLIISSDGSGVDLGYPSTVELEDRSLLTVWYERLSDSPRAVLRQAHWRFAT